MYGSVGSLTSLIAPCLSALVSAVHVDGRVAYAAERFLVAAPLLCLSSVGVDGQLAIDSTTVEGELHLRQGRGLSWYGLIQAKVPTAS